MPTIMTIGFEAVLIPFNSPTFHRIDAAADQNEFGEYVSVSEDGAWLSNGMNNDGQRQMQLWEFSGGNYVLRDTENSNQSGVPSQMTPDGLNSVMEFTGTTAFNVPRSGAVWGTIQSLVGGTNNQEDVPARDSNIFALNGDRLVLRSGGGSTDNWSYWTRSGSTYTFGAQLDIGNTTVGIVSISHDGNIVCSSNDSTDQLKIWEWNGSAYIDTQTISSGTLGLSTIGSCALNDDGSVIAIGGFSQGTKILVRSGTWSVTQTLTAIDGDSVSMAKDGLLVIGDSAADVYGGTPRGVVHVHKIAGTTYPTTATSVVEIPSADVTEFSTSVVSFGGTVRIAPDGSRFAVSALGAEHSPGQVGSAYVVIS